MLTRAAQIRQLYTRLPKATPDGKRLQMVVCSATLHHPDVVKLAADVMYHPTWVDLKGLDVVPDPVHHVVALVDPVADDAWTTSDPRLRTDGIHARDPHCPGLGSPGARQALSEGRGEVERELRHGRRAAHIARAPPIVGPSVRPSEGVSEAIKRLKFRYVLQAIRQHNMEQALLFCRTKVDCDNLEAFLVATGGGAAAMVNEFSCACMHSDRNALERRNNLQAFKDGDVRFLICTDVAARGIDIRGIPCVASFALGRSCPLIPPAHSKHARVRAAQLCRLRDAARRARDVPAPHRTRRACRPHGPGHLPGGDAAREGLVPPLRLARRQV